MSNNNTFLSDRMLSNIEIVRKNAKFLFEKAGSVIDTSEPVYSVTGSIPTSEATHNKIKSAAVNLNLPYELRKFQIDCVQALVNGQDVILIRYIMQGTLVWGSLVWANFNGLLKIFVTSVIFPNLLSHQYF